MKSIRLQELRKSFQGEPIIDSLSLTIPAGSFFALLGPSGCGKTTILRLIAGFEFADAGTIYLGHEDITRLASNERRVNTVFQQYALFPHMTVFENVAFGLVVKGTDRAEINKRVMRILHSVHLHDYAHKSIKRLSGGQQQRVALARAIVNEPEVLLLDEPLAALDVSLRERMLLELIELQEKIKTTFLYVTHDPSEALTAADYIAIMNADGYVEQVGTPKEIYEFPQSSFVAQFVGGTNVFTGVLREETDGWMLHVDQIGDFVVDVSRLVHPRDEMPAMLSVRPEKFFISKQPHEGFANRLSGTVQSIVYHGRSTQYNILLAAGKVIQVFEQNEEHFPAQVIDYDQHIWVQWQKDNGVILTR